MVPLRQKVTEFLPLLEGINNLFTLKIYDADQNAVNKLTNEISITHGQYIIAGQPLPKDICIEVDDVENNKTKLDVIFERNSILPLKKTLYKEISKTVNAGSTDSIIINILEGSRFARPVSNLTIGCIEITGKDLKSNLLKGSDIEIQISISESRELRTEVFLVMTGQEFKNVFSISEKHVSITRLQEQFMELEAEIRSSLKEFDREEDDVWSIQTNALLTELMSYKKDLFKLTNKDKSDRKYVIMETVNRISQKLDSIGGNDRIARLCEQYLDVKEKCKQAINEVEFEKEELIAEYNRLVKPEEQFLRSKNQSIILQAINALDDLHSKSRWHLRSFIISVYMILKSNDSKEFTSYRSAQSIFNLADKALEEEKYTELRSYVFSLLNLLHQEQKYTANIDFKGSGIS